VRGRDKFAAPFFSRQNRILLFAAMVAVSERSYNYYLDTKVIDWIKIIVNYYFGVDILDRKLFIIGYSTG